MRLHSACAVALCAVFALQVAQVVRGARQGPWLHDPEDGGMPEVVPAHGHKPHHQGGEHGGYGTYVILDYGYSYTYGYSGYGYEPDHHGHGYGYVHHEHPAGHYLPIKEHHSDPGPNLDDDMIPAVETVIAPAPAPRDDDNGEDGGDDEHEHGPHGGMSTPTPSSDGSSSKGGAVLDTTTVNESPDFPSAPETLAPPNAPWPLKSDARDALGGGVSAPPELDIFPPEPYGDAPPAR